MNKMKFFPSLAIFVIIATSVSCSKKDESEPIPAPVLKTFAFLAANNAGVLSEDYQGTIEGTAVTVTMPSTIDKSSLIATFTTNEGDVVTIGSAVQTTDVTANDFSVPVDYSLANSDASLNSLYTVTIAKKTDMNWTASAAYVGTSTVYSGAIMKINPKDNSPLLAFKVRADSVVTGNVGKMTLLRFSNNSWEKVGNEAFSAQISGSEMDLDIMEDGTPYVAFENAEATVNKCASVMSYNGSAWNYVGDAAISSDMASTKVHFAVISANDIILAQVNNKAGSFARRIMVMSSYKGNAWSNAENPAMTSGFQVYDEKIAKVGDCAYLAIISRDAGYACTVLKYQGDKWTSLLDNYTTANSTGNSIAALDLVALEDGTLFLLTADDAVTTGSYQLRLQKYSPSTNAWTTVGGNPLSYIIESHNYARVAIAPDGTPYVAYQNYANKQIEICHIDSDTKQWSSPTIISPLVGNSCSGLSICFAGTGTGFLGYIDGDSHYQLYQYK